MTNKDGSLIPPLFGESMLKNITCKEASYWSDPNPTYSLSDIATLILFTGLHLASLVLNGLWALTLLNKSYGPNLHESTKVCLLACSLHGIIHGILVLVTSLYTLLTHCWPFGSFTCKLQAMAFGGLGHHYVCLIIIISLERFWSIHRREEIYRFMYRNHITTYMIIFALLVSFGLYWFLVFFLQRYKVSTSSLQVCEAVHISERVQIMSLCAHYFMPTLVLMYCYGYIFHYHQIEKINSARPKEDALTGAKEEGSLEMECSYRLSRITALMSLIFNIVITPSTLKDVFIMIGGSQPSIATNLFISWLNGSYYLFNPLFNYILDPNFRRVLSVLIREDLLCRPSLNAAPCCSSHNIVVRHAALTESDAPGSSTISASTQKHGSNTTQSHCCPPPLKCLSLECPPHPGRHFKKSGRACYVDIGEKHWGEILEKSLSYRNIHNGKDPLGSPSKFELSKPQSISLNNLIRK